ncbi:MAG TPA: exodeoxyribonuclease VII large subunit [Gammaproteobacteria bacterium]
MSTRETLSLPFEEGRQIFTVSGLNREARLLIERRFGLVWVEGEISNLSRPSSGHLYWTLKDAGGQVRCAMFRARNRSLDTPLDNGLKVVVRARVTLYEARGEFQLVVEEVEPAGEGLLRRRFEELKRKLAAEGLFDTARKRRPPRVPERIGVVTSPTGAAVRDVLIALRRRFPAIPVLIYPTSVQGNGAAEEIRRTLELANRRADCDVLILTRGGGSLEDLWSFNEEIVARAIAASRIPVIVGVGHEVDFTIADFVADVRAPTPSQAAELAVPDRTEWCVRLERATEHVCRAVRRRLSLEARQLAALSHRLHRCSPGVQVREASQRLDEMEIRMRRALGRAVEARRAHLARLTAALAGKDPRHRLAALEHRRHRASDRLERAIGQRLADAAGRLALATRALESLSPLATLERGYAIVARRGGGILTDAGSVAVGTELEVRLARGRLGAVVDRTDPGEEQDA